MKKNGDMPRVRGGGASWKGVAAMGFGQGNKMMQVDSKKTRGLWCPERDKWGQELLLSGRWEWARLQDTPQSFA